MTMKKPRTVTVVAGSVVLAGLVLLATVRPSVADAPAGRFTVSGGTAADAKTGLVWQRVVPSGTYTWAQADTYCASNTGGLPGSGWRLPSLLELQTIVDDSRASPAIDPTVFPNTPPEYFWTSSTEATGTPATNYKWYVRFDYGSTLTDEVANTHRLRCVR
jgi:hypothetical protein